jgi:hypothetical protein
LHDKSLATPKVGSPMTTTMLIAVITSISAFSHPQQYLWPFLDYTNRS